MDKINDTVEMPGEQQSSLIPGVVTSGGIDWSLRSLLESRAPDTIGPAERNRSTPSLGPVATLSD